MDKKHWIRPLLVAVLLAATMALTGCSDGDDGAPGLSAYQIAVQNGFTGTEEEWLQSLQAGTIDPESCAICHNGNVVRDGVSHQEPYDQLFQQGVVVIDLLSFTYESLPDGVGGFNDVVTFQMTKNGAPFDCTTLHDETIGALSIGFSQFTAGAVAGTGTFTAPDTGAPAGFGNRITIGTSGRILPTPQASTLTYDAGTNVCTSTKAQSALGDLSLLNGVLVVYGQDEFVQTFPGHITLAKFPFAAVRVQGTVDYLSQANATGCENCHTSPYYKHGFIIGDASLGGGQDFYTCKICHLDNGAGGHEEWQIAVDNPMRWAEIWNGAALTPAEEAQYAYTTRLMNDVHMSHAMEFPYPQNIRNCNTCHATKLTQTLSDANFTAETCKSCHPITGGTDTANADGDFAVDTRGMALQTIWENKGVALFHDINSTCNSAGCHVSGGNGLVFSAIHTGYNPKIYDETTGNKYAAGITASIDSVTVSGTDLDIQISATGSVGGLNAASITPIVMVAFYGYDTKDFIISNQTRDANGVRMVKTFGTDNPLFTETDSGGTDGTWAVTLHMANFVAPDPTILGSITDLIASGVIKKAEVAFRPVLDKPAINDEVGLNAVSRTVDVTNDAIDPFVPDYFSGAEAIVSVDGTGSATKGCNSCHDQLATTFHSGDRGGSIVVCRMCHVVTEGGSHLEGQSRSIDSYVHAVHRFQAFDVDEVDFNDPVEKARYEEHIEFLFPDFAIINCMACHNSGKFNVPDQSKSMPGVLSATDEIPGVVPATTPEVVVGPAARACGACHRAEFINDNDAGGFAAFNSHTKEFGYRVENDANDSVLYGIIDTIMSMFQ